MNDRRSKQAEDTVDYERLRVQESAVCVFLSFFLVCGVVCVWGGCNVWGVYGTQFNGNEREETGNITARVIVSCIQPFLCLRGD